MCVWWDSLVRKCCEPKHHQSHACHCLANSSKMPYLCAGDILPAEHTSVSKCPIQLCLCWVGPSLLVGLTEEPYQPDCVLRVRSSYTDKEEVFRLPDVDSYQDRAFLEAVCTCNLKLIQSKYKDTNKTWTIMGHQDDQYVCCPCWSPDKRSNKVRPLVRPHYVLCEVTLHKRLTYSGVTSPALPEVGVGRLAWRTGSPHEKWRPDGKFYPCTGSSWESLNSLRISTIGKPRGLFLIMRSFH